MAELNASTESTFALIQEEIKQWLAEAETVKSLLALGDGNETRPYRRSITNHHS